VSSSNRPLEAAVQRQGSLPTPWGGGRCLKGTVQRGLVRITAVLERTCVYVDRDGDRRLARKNDPWVEADKLPIRRRSAV